MAGKGGTVDVTATVGGQTSAATSADQFSYPSTCTSAGLSTNPSGTVDIGQTITLSAASSGWQSVEFAEGAGTTAIPRGPSG